VKKALGLPCMHARHDSHQVGHDTHHLSGSVAGSFDGYWPGCTADAKDAPNTYCYCRKPCPHMHTRCAVPAAAARPRHHTQKPRWHAATHLLIQRQAGPLRLCCPLLAAAAADARGLHHLSCVHQPLERRVLHTATPELLQACMHPAAAPVNSPADIWSRSASGGQVVGAAQL